MSHNSSHLKDEPHSGFFRGFFSPYYFLASYFRKETEEERESIRLDISRRRTAETSNFYRLLNELSLILGNVLQIHPNDIYIFYHKNSLLNALDRQDRVAIKYSLNAIGSILNTKKDLFVFINSFNTIRREILDYANEYMQNPFIKHDTHRQAIEETLVFQSGLIQEKIFENEKAN